ncbi:MAG: hypothetical protein WCA77_04430 [Thermoplasmata archaeon]
MAAPEHPNRLLTILIIVIVIAASFGVGYVFFTTRAHGPPGIKTVQLGDNVTVNYIGILGSSPQQGRVFDTSYYAVAISNATYPKSLEFTLRPSAANYTPLGVNVNPGNLIPSGGYTLNGTNTTFGAVVTGFWQGLLGLPGNETRSIRIPPALGYGLDDPACIVTRPLTYTVPVVSSYNLNQFSTEFPGIVANPGVEFPAPSYGWPMYILSSNATAVTISNQTHAGAIVRPYGFPVLVSNVSNTLSGRGQITLVNQLTLADSGLVLGKDSSPTAPCQNLFSSTPAGGKFIVSAVNPTAGTYAANYNLEEANQTLIFQVSVVNIYP